MSQTTAITLLEDLEKINEQAQLRSAVRGWWKAKQAAEKSQHANDEGCSNDDGCEWHKSEYGMATEYLEKVARRLEGM